MKYDFWDTESKMTAEEKSADKILKEIIKKIRDYNMYIPTKKDLVFKLHVEDYGYRHYFYCCHNCDIQHLCSSEEEAISILAAIKKLLKEDGYQIIETSDKEFLFSK